MTNNLAIRILSGEVLGTNEQTHEAVYMAIKALKAEPIRHGKWIHNDIMETDICSCCHTLLECDVRGFNYCPYCGAKMDEVNNEKDYSNSDLFNDGGRISWMRKP
ncbi:MAG: hypothetical protein II453_11385 [Alphaproteobacteria bacterium]|nr:hypothetical protein [Alphaproteobacteria bacterium]